MHIISHRGYWHCPEEKNRIVAFKRSFELGFGTETDVRDYNGKLVISHDIPTGNELSVLDFFQLIDDKTLQLALNIKSDGLLEPLLSEIKKAGVENAFVFDMSIPDQRSYLTQKVVKVFTRLSEEEKIPSFYKECQGIWLDSFYGLWFNAEKLRELLSDGKEVCIVSPELHKREHSELWRFLLSTGLSKEHNLILCTDFPVLASEYFGNSRLI